MFYIHVKDEGRII